MTRSPASSAAGRGPTIRLRLPTADAPARSFVPLTPGAAHLPPQTALAAVFLDAGGTLIRERVPREVLYARAAHVAGLEVTPGEMRSWMHRTHAALPRSLNGDFRYSRGWFAAFIERIFVDALGLAPARLAGVREELFARFSDARSYELVAGARELVEDLAGRGLTLGVVSNWSEALPGLLEGLGLAPRLDFVLVSASEGCEKPEPEFFRRALERAGVRPAQALHAGNDPELDVQGARRAGILPVLVGPGELPPGSPAGAAHVADLPQLARWIQESLP